MCRLTAIRKITYKEHTIYRVMPKCSKRMTKNYYLQDISKNWKPLGFACKIPLSFLCLLTLNLVVEFQQSNCKFALDACRLGLNLNRVVPKTLMNMVYDAALAKRSANKSSAEAEMNSETNSRKCIIGPRATKSQLLKAP